MDDRPLILCANDDGVSSRGLLAAAEALATFADVVVVAPETEQSAMSHSLTLHRPLRLRKVDVARWALDGTPADCVYLALHLGDPEGNHPPPATPEEAERLSKLRVLPRRPDLVVSGINRGINLGQDVFYSGTVAAAREGALRGVPSLAISCEVVADASGAYSYDPSHAAGLAVQLARSIIAAPRIAGEPTLLLNVNLPAGPVKGVRATRLGNRLWTEAVEARVDPRGRPYFWLSGRGVEHDQIPGSDTEAFDQGFVAVTALNLDLARHDDAAQRSLVTVLGAL
jgi:5'-nucleotidase